MSPLYIEHWLSIYRTFAFNLWATPQPVNSYLLSLMSKICFWFI